LVLLLSCGLNRDFEGARKALRFCNEGQVEKKTHEAVEA
jgi:hypothetical protein